MGAFHFAKCVYKCLFKNKGGEEGVLKKQQQNDKPSLDIDMNSLKVLQETSFDVIRKLFSQLACRVVSFNTKESSCKVI